MDLGKYAQPVIWAYVGALALLGIVIAVSLWQAGRARRALRDAETRQEKAHG